MRKYLSVFLSFMVLFAIVVPSAFAEDSDADADSVVEELETTGSEVISIANTEESDDETEQSIEDGDLESSNIEKEFTEEEIKNFEEAIENIKDVTNEKNTTFPLEIYLGEWQGPVGYIPNFTMVLRTEEGIEISRAVANESNFDRNTNSYKLFFQTEGYSLGDKLQIYLEDTESIIESVTIKVDYFNSNGEYVVDEYTMKKDTYATIEVVEHVYYEDLEETQLVRGFYPSTSFPVIGKVNVKTTNVVLKVVNKSGTPIKSTPVTVRYSFNESEDFTTDSKGVVWVNKNKLSDFFQVAVKGYNIYQEDGETIESSIIFDTFGVDDVRYIPTYYVVVDQVENEAGTSLTVKVDSKGNTTISNAWKIFDIRLEDSEGGTILFSLDGEQGSFSVDNGEYRLTALSEFADVILDKDKISINGNNIEVTATISPKYTLKVDKDGKSYNFSFLNIDGLVDTEFKGTDGEEFSVVPYESYMIKDNETGEVYSIMISPDSTLTRLVLGHGLTIGGSVTTPHTGDAILILTILLVLSLCGAGLFYFLYKRKTGLKNKVVNTSLVLILVMGSFAPFIDNVEATGKAPGSGVGSGVPADKGTSTGTPAGLIQTSKTVSALMVSFTSGRSGWGNHKLDYDTSTKEDFNSGFLWEKNRYRNALFVATNKDNYNKLKNGSFALAEHHELRMLQGKNIFYKDSDPNEYKHNLKNLIGSESDEYLPKRLLDVSNYDYSDKNDNKFLRFLAIVVDHLGAENAQRQLWKGEDSTSGINVGDAIDTQYSTKVGSLTDITHQDMFNGYLELLREVGEHRVADQLETYAQYSKDRHVFVFQVVQGFHVAGDQSKYLFTPMADAVEWYYFGRSKQNSSIRGLPYYQQEYILYKVNEGKSDNWAKIAPVHTYKWNTVRTAGIAVKPKSKLVPVPSSEKDRPKSFTADSVAINPFTGWGFLNWKHEWVDAETNPKIMGEVVVDVVDKETNEVTDTFTIPYKFGSNTINNEGLPSRPLNTFELSGVGEQHISGPMYTRHNGKFYRYEKGTAELKLQDIRDNESLLKLDSRGVVDILNGVNTVEKLDIQVPSHDNEDVWKLYFGFDLPNASQMYRYLGGDVNVEDPTKNKYAKVLDPKTNKPIFSNAKFSLRLKAVEEDPEITTDEQSVSGLHVPEWRLTKYFDNISPDERSFAKYYLSFSDSTRINPRLTNSGTTKFNLISPDLSSVKWARSKAVLHNGDTATRNVGHTSSSRQGSFDLAGDLLAIKVNDDISKTKLASWKGTVDLFDKAIKTTSKGEPSTSNKVTMRHKFIYGVKSPYSSYLYSEQRWSCCDSEGRGGYYRHYDHNTKMTYTNSEYDVTVDFLNYISKDNKETPKISSVSSPSNGIYREVRQSPLSIFVNPEVVMLYDDVTGKTSAVWVAGDRLREIKPVTYNTVKYVDMDTKTTTSGMSTATDMKAKQLANSLGAGDKGVIYKGSSVSVGHDITGQLEMKSYTLDIGNSALKNSWGNSSYSTDAIRNEFMQRFATRNASTGKWEVVYNTEGKFKINGNLYGGVKDSYKVEETNSTVKEYRLEIQGGKLIRVNGSPVTSLPADVQEALEAMKISGDGEIFSNFERGGGAKADAEYAKYANLIRGTNTIKAGDGWYNEDTTVLVLREYTTLFDLPKVMYNDKLPMEIDELVRTPIDKSQFFTKGHRGHLWLKINVNDAYAEYDSSQSTPFGGPHEINYVVPNVSVTDSFR